MRTRLIIAAALLFVACRHVGADTVERRGGEAPLTGEVRGVSDAGVEIISDLGATTVVPWDRVREVVDPDHESQVAKFMENAVALWRARSRVERNDLVLAEPLLERLFETYRGQSHETALVVAEGLLRCRLARGAHALALIPALEVMRLKRAGHATQSYRWLQPIMDETTGLCIALAPFWLESPLLARLEQDLSEFRAPGDAVTEAVAALYAESVRRVRAPGGDIVPPAPPVPLPSGEALTLLAEILACGDNDGAIRESARETLLRRETSLPPFARAWIRFHVGWSLLHESGVVRRQRGMMNLLHVPAEYGDSQPYLAGIAMKAVSQELLEQGDALSAESLLEEFSQRYPFHPVRSARLPRAFTPSVSNP